MKKEYLSTQTFWTIAVFVGTLTYAIIRYIIFGAYGVHDIPLFILNKAVSWSSVMLLCAAILQKQEFRLISFQYVKLLLIIHGGISLILLSPEVYPQFYLDSSFTFTGGFAMLTGILCFTALFYKIIIPSQKPGLHGSFTSRLQLTMTALLLLLFHTAFIGAPGWVSPENWNGSMPPITLLAFLTGLVALILTIVKRNAIR